jgi:hypothetical protein
MIGRQVVRKQTRVGTIIVRSKLGQESEGGDDVIQI